MHKLKHRGIVVLTVVGLFAFSGIAMADSHEEPEEDTVFNYGYDEENQFLIWNVTSLDYEPDEELLSEALFENYEDLLMSCSLEGTESFDGYTFDGDALKLLKGEDPVDPETLDPRCGGFFFGEVSGPNGQVNHGMFMKLFNELYGQYEGPASRGCLIRHLTKSDLGKGDQKVKVSDAKETDSEAIEVEPVEETTGSIEFTTVEADCTKGKKDGKGGPPDHVLEKWAEKWEDGKPGKRGNAGGRP